MSTIRKKPFLKGMLEAMSAEDIATLKSLLNNSSTANAYADYNTVPEDAVSCVDFHYEPTKCHHAIFINEENQKVLLVYFPFDKGLYDKAKPAQIVEFYNVDLTNKTCTQVQEYCDINELRSELDDQIEHGGDEWVERMKEVMDYDDETGETQIGTDAYVDGALRINDITYFHDADGNNIFPDPTGQNGKFLKAGTTGMVWAGGGTQLYKHTLTIHTNTGGATRNYILISLSSTDYTGTYTQSFYDDWLAGKFVKLLMVSSDISYDGAGKHDVMITYYKNGSNPVELIGVWWEQGMGVSSMSGNIWETGCTITDTVTAL